MKKNKKPEWVRVTSAGRYSVWHTFELFEALHVVMNTWPPRGENLQRDVIFYVLNEVYRKVSASRNRAVLTKAQAYALAGIMRHYQSPGLGGLYIQLCKVLNAKESI